MRAEGSQGSAAKTRQAIPAAIRRSFREAPEVRRLLNAHDLLRDA